MDSEDFEKHLAVLEAQDRARERASQDGSVLAVTREIIEAFTPKNTVKWRRRSDVREQLQAIHDACCEAMLCLREREVPDLEQAFQAIHDLLTATRKLDGHARPPSRDVYAQPPQPPAVSQEGGK